MFATANVAQSLQRTSHPGYNSQRESSAGEPYPRYSSQYFPVRPLIRIGESDGAWLVAHKAEEQRRFDQILRRHRPSKKSSLNAGGTSAADPKSAGASRINEEEETCLDGFFLMRLVKVEDPSFVCSIDISGRGLTDVKEEDLQLFDSVTSLKAGENIMRMEPLNGFVNLRELEIPFNGLRNLQLNADMFPNLEFLDVSYNELSAEDIFNIGLLRNLRRLHASGNGLQQLPDDLALPDVSDEGKKNRTRQEASQRYQKLEYLLLDDNQLSDPKAFASLAGLRKLKVLSLERNHFTSIPFLQSVSADEISLSATASGRTSRKSKSGRRSVRSSRTASTKEKIIQEDEGLIVSAKSLTRSSHPAEEAAKSPKEAAEKSPAAKSPKEAAEKSPAAKSPKEAASPRAASRQSPLVRVPSAGGIAPASQVVGEVADQQQDLDSANQEAANQEAANHEAANHEAANQEAANLIQPHKDGQDSESNNMDHVNHGLMAEARDEIQSEQQDEQKVEQQDEQKVEQQDEQKVEQQDEQKVEQQDEQKDDQQSEPHGEQKVEQQGELQNEHKNEQLSEREAEQPSEQFGQVDGQSEQNNEQSEQNNEQSEQNNEQSEQNNEQNEQNNEQSEQNNEQSEQNNEEHNDVPDKEDIKDMEAEAEDNKESGANPTKSRGSVATSQLNREIEELNLQMLRTNRPASAPLVSMATFDLREIDRAIAARLVGDDDDGVAARPPPFPSLRSLNLGQNRVSREEGFIAAAVWPLLSELLIYDNPLCRQRSGELPLLHRMLTRRLGVRVLKQKPQQRPKPPIEVQHRPSRRVRAVVPKVPKVDVDSLLLSIQAPPVTAATAANTQNPNVTVPSAAPDVKDDESDWSDGEAAAAGGEGGGVFLTSVGNQRAEASAGNAAAASGVREEEEEEDDDGLDESQLQDLLLSGTYDDSSEAEELPKDVLGSVKALEYLLNHPVTLQHERPPLAAAGATYREHRPSRQPPAQPRKTRSQQVAEALDATRRARPQVELPLAKVLQPKKPLPSRNRRQLEPLPRGEAERLLASIQRKYHGVRDRSLQTAKKQAKENITEMVEDIRANVRDSLLKQNAV